MKSCALFKILVLVCLLFWANISVEASLISGEKILLANFGKVTATETVAQKLTLPYTIKLEKGCGLTVLGETPGLINQVSGKSIAWERVKLLFLGKAWNISSYKALEVSTVIEAREMLLMVQCLFEASDRPGNYEGMITLQPWREVQNGMRENLKPVKILVKFEISPWIKLSNEVVTVNINEVASDGLSLKRGMPLSLKIASNAKWAVSLALDKNSNSILKAVPFNVKTVSTNNSFQEFSQVFRDNNLEAKKIAIGMPTVNAERYWCEIPLYFMIESYLKYPAGKVDFQFHCVGELFDN